MKLFAYDSSSDLQVILKLVECWTCTLKPCRMALATCICTSWAACTLAASVFGETFICMGSGKTNSTVVYLEAGFNCQDSLDTIGNYSCGRSGHHSCAVHSQGQSPDWLTQVGPPQPWLWHSQGQIQDFEKGGWICHTSLCLAVVMAAGGGSRVMLPLNIFKSTLQMLHFTTNFDHILTSHISINSCFP